MANVRQTFRITKILIYFNTKLNFIFNPLNFDKWHENFVPIFKWHDGNTCYTGTCTFNYILILSTTAIGAAICTFEKN